MSTREARLRESQAQYLVRRNERLHRTCQPKVSSKAIVLGLSYVDFLVLLVIETVSAWRQFDADQWYWLLPLGTARFWGCAAVLLVSSLLVTIYVEDRRFNQNPWLYWILKDLVAANAIGFHLWFSSIEPDVRKVHLHAAAYTLQQGLSVALYFSLLLFTVVQYVLYSTGGVLVSAALLVWNNLLLECLFLLVVGVVFMLWVIHLNIVKSNNNIARSNDNIARVTDRSHKRLAREIQAASNNVVVSINQNTTVVSGALQDASHNIRSGMRGASGEMRSALDRTAASVDRAVQGQNRHIDTLGRNVVGAIADAAIYEGNVIAGAALEHRDRPAIAFSERVDLIDDGINAVGNIANAANSTMQLLGLCNIM